MPEHELPVEITRQAENQETQELSSEVLEIVTRKVQDINKNNVAFHTISRPRFENFKDILRDGLLGRGKGTTGVDGRIDPRRWAQSVRKNKISEIYFNITGRFKTVLYAEDKEGKEVEEILPPKIENAMWGAKENTTILFDLKTFKESEPVQGAEDEVNKKAPVHGFARNLHPGGHDNDLINDEGKSVSASSQLGFQLKARVAPRFFTGIVLGPNRSYQSPLSPKELDERVKQIVQNMREVYKDKQNLILPIYDIKGNLLWPKHMIYQDVRKFVAERDKGQDLDSGSSPE